MVVCRDHHCPLLTTCCIAWRKSLKSILVALALCSRVLDSNLIPLSRPLYANHSHLDVRDGFLQCVLDRWRGSCTKYGNLGNISDCTDHLFSFLGILLLGGHTLILCSSRWFIIRSVNIVLYGNIQRLFDYCVVVDKHIINYTIRLVIHWFDVCVDTHWVVQYCIVVDWWATFDSL